MMTRLTLDVEEWGRLVKSWATDENYVDTPPAGQPPRGTPIPDDAAWKLPAPTPVAVKTGSVAATIPKAWVLAADDAKARMQAANVQIAAQSGYDAFDRVILVQGDEKTLVLRLPSADRIRASEDQLLAAPAGSAYGLPTFYDLLYAVFTGGVPNAAPMPSGREGIMRLHANRIGDYSMSQCM